MRSRKPRIRFVALAAVLALLMVACGDDDAATTTTAAATTTTVDSATTTTNADSATTTEAELVVGEPIRIGMVMSLTGSAAGAGLGLANAERLAVERINEQGGVRIGNTLHPLELVEYDDQGTAEGGIAAFTRMVEQDGIRLHVGLVASGVATGVLPYYEGLGDDFASILVGASLASLTEPNNTFRMAATAPLIAIQAVNYASQQGWTKMVDIGDVTNAAWVEAEPGYHASLEAVGISVVGFEQIERGQPDFTNVITKVMNSGADYIHLKLFPDDELLFIKQMREFGWDIPVLLVATITPSQVGGIVSAEQMTNVIQPSWAQIQDLIAAGTPGAQELFDAYVAEFGEEPGFLTMQGYEGVNAMAAAIAQAQSSDPAAVRAALECLAPYPAMIWPITARGGCVFQTDLNGESLVPFALGEWVDGVLEFGGLLIAAE